MVCVAFFFFLIEDFILINCGIIMSMFVNTIGTCNIIQTYFLPSFHFPSFSPSFLPQPVSIFLYVFFRACFKPLSIGRFPISLTQHQSSYSYLKILQDKMLSSNTRRVCWALGEESTIAFPHMTYAVSSPQIHETVVLVAKRTSAALPLSISLLLLPALCHSSFMPVLAWVKNVLSCGEHHAVGWAGVLWDKLLELVFSPKALYHETAP